MPETNIFQQLEKLASSPQNLIDDEFAALCTFVNDNMRDLTENAEAEAIQHSFNISNYRIILRLLSGNDAKNNKDNIALIKGWYNQGKPKDLSTLIKEWAINKLAGTYATCKSFLDHAQLRDSIPEHVAQRQRPIL